MNDLGTSSGHRTRVIRLRGETCKRSNIAKIVESDVKKHTHTHARARTHARTRTRTRTHTHTHTNTHKHSTSCDGIYDILPLSSLYSWSCHRRTRTNFNWVIPALSFLLPEHYITAITVMQNAIYV